MGLNVDLVKMLGVPSIIICKKCNNSFDSQFDDYDIECGDPNPVPGFWQLSCYCPICEHTFKYSFYLQLLSGSGSYQILVNKDLTESICTSLENLKKNNNLQNDSNRLPMVLIATLNNIEWEETNSIKNAVINQLRDSRIYKK